MFTSCVSKIRDGCLYFRRLSPKDSGWLITIRAYPYQWRMKIVWGLGDNYPHILGLQCLRCYLQHPGCWELDARPKKKIMRLEEFNEFNLTIIERTTIIHLDGVPYMSVVTRRQTGWNNTHSCPIPSNLRGPNTYTRTMARYRAFPLFRELLVEDDSTYQKCFRTKGIQRSVGDYYE